MNYVTCEINIKKQGKNSLFSQIIIKYNKKLSQIYSINNYLYYGTIKISFTFVFEMKTKCYLYFRHSVKWYISVKNQGKSMKTL